MDDLGTSSHSSSSVHGFTAVVPWLLTGVGQTGDYEAPLAVGFLPMGSGHRGESVLPTLGW
jgi:hypothetical protein